MPWPLRRLYAEEEGFIIIPFISTALREQLLSRAQAGEKTSTYEYWMVLSNTQLDGEIESVHLKNFKSVWKKSQESNTGLNTA